MESVGQNFFFPPESITPSTIGIEFRTHIPTRPFVFNIYF